VWESVCGERRLVRGDRSGVGVKGERGERRRRGVIRKRYVKGLIHVKRAYLLSSFS
jgi:hypothetical protein